MSMIRTAGGLEPVLMKTDKAGQVVHRWWWTALPAIPRERESHAYKRLSRHFADHTMNTFKFANGSVRAGSRGFYVEGREDHLVPAFFENFTLFPSPTWLRCVLDTLEIPIEGRITEASWSYSYSEVLKGLRLHADIVTWWRDNAGEAVLVLEAKKPGVRRIAEKDDPAGGAYLNFYEMEGITRRFQALLAAEGDFARLGRLLTPSAKTLTWERLVEIQLALVDELETDDSVREALRERLNAHFQLLGLSKRAGDSVSASARPERYAQLNRLDAPARIRDWMIGSEVYFAGRSNEGVVEVPYRWLLDELSAIDYARLKRQSTAERECVLWKTPVVDN